MKVSEKNNTSNLDKYYFTIRQTTNIFKTELKTLFSYQTKNLHTLQSVVPLTLILA